MVPLGVYRKYGFPNATINALSVAPTLARHQRTLHLSAASLFHTTTMLTHAATSRCVVYNSF
jgi:hypothetical protein